MEKTKQYINNKFNKNIEEYLYYKMKSKFDEEAAKFYDKAKLLKKNNVISQEEKEENDRKMKEHRIQMEKEVVEKTNLMKELWRSRSQFIPKYKSPILNVIKKEKEQEQENIEMEKAKIKVLAKQKKIYALEKIPKPEIDNKLRKERELRIKILEAKPINNSKGNIIGGDKVNDINNNNNNQSNKNIFMTNQSAPKLFIAPRITKTKITDFNIKQSNKLNQNQTSQIIKHKNNLNSITSHNTSNNFETYHQIYKSNSAYDVATNKKVNEILNKKPLKAFKSPVRLNPKPSKPIDYLSEMRIQRTMNVGGKPVNWSKLASNPKGSKMENLQVIKNKIESMESKARQQQDLMRINGGYSKNPELGDNITDLLIDSIQAKLTIINSLSTKLKTKTEDGIPLSSPRQNMESVTLGNNGDEGMNSNDGNKINNEGK